MNDPNLPSNPLVTRVLASPNFNDRNPQIPLRYVILHYTGMKTQQEAEARLCDPTAQVSAHYMIGESGVITQFVAEDKRAWHAGQSCWEGIQDMNSASIGIELVNPGHAFGYRPFPAPQILSLQKLLADLKTRHHFRATAFLGHADIAPLRKQDPGELFPWQDLAAQGFGIWPHLTPPTTAPLLCALSPQELIAETCRRLQALGYKIDEEEAKNPENLQSVVLAFQRHFTPHDLSGKITRTLCHEIQDVLNVKNIHDCQ